MAKYKDTRHKNRELQYLPREENKEENKMNRVPTFTESMIVVAGVATFAIYVFITIS